MPVTLLSLHHLYIYKRTNEISKLCKVTTLKEDRPWIRPAWSEMKKNKPEIWVDQKNETVLRIEKLENMLVLRPL